MIFSTLGRYVRSLFGFDEERNARIARGEPHPIGSSGCGIWIAFYCDGEPAVYLICDGPTLHNPVAMAGLHTKNLSREDYRIARRIAVGRDFGRDDVIDLRNANDEETFENLFGLDFFPTDRHGNKRSDCRHHGASYVMDGGKLAVFTALVPHYRPNAAQRVPTFEMSIDDGLQPVPTALKNHLDQIDSQPIKNGGLMPVTHVPGQSESHKAAATAA